MGEMCSIRYRASCFKTLELILGKHQNFNAIFYMGRLNAPLGDQSGRLNAHQIFLKKI